MHSFLTEEYSATSQRDRSPDEFAMHMHGTSRKLNLGVEWHGIIRAARGWRFGAMIEYTPIKDQVVELELITVPFDEYQDNGNAADPDLIYNQIPVQSNFLKIVSFASWSPWNSSIFIRWSMLWSPNRIEGALALGYYF